MLHWLTTAPSERYRHKTHSADDGQRGWRQHAVEAPDTATFTQVRLQRSLCGLLPAHGWGLDMFIEQRCARCEKAASGKS